MSSKRKADKGLLKPGFRCCLPRKKSQALIIVFSNHFAIVAASICMSNAQQHTYQDTGRHTFQRLQRAFSARDPCLRGDFNRSLVVSSIAQL